MFILPAKIKQLFLTTKQIRRFLSVETKGGLIHYEKARLS